MAKYLLLKHYRGAPEAVNNVPMDQWTAGEIQDHLQFMADFATRLEGTGEYVDGQALSPRGPGLPRCTAASAYLHEKAGDLVTAARLYAEAARSAPNLAERHHLTRQAARISQTLRG
jgi:hypothetical protein